MDPSTHPVPSSVRSQNAGPGAHHRAPTWLLACGAIVGAALAAWGLLEPATAPDSATLAPRVAALVNGRPVLRADLERAVLAFADTRAARAHPKRLRRRILGRLIEEELLVQRGLELGLASRDARVRSDLGAAVISLIAARADEEDRTPSDAEVRSFWRERAAYFRRPVVLRATQLFYAAPRARDDADALRRARGALARLQRGATMAGERAHADRPPVPLPSSPLPLRRLAQLLGPTAARALAEHSRGLTRPVRSRHGYHLFDVIERSGGELPPLAQIRDRVVRELRRRRGERRLRRFLERRRAAARIRVAPDLR